MFLYVLSDGNKVSENFAIQKITIEMSCLNVEVHKFL